MTDNRFKTHHVHLTTDFIQTEQPTTILISGSPGRTREIYDRLDIKDGDLVETDRVLPIGKGFLERTIDGEQHKIPIVVATTGMGFGSTEIITNEIIETYVQAFTELFKNVCGRTRMNPINIIRVGTSGSHQPHVYGGDVVIGTDTYVPFGSISDLVLTREDQIRYHLEKAGMLIGERITEIVKKKLPDRYKLLHLANIFTLEALKYELSKSEITKSHPCDNRLVNATLGAANELMYVGDIIKVGPVFSKLTLYSESIEDFPIDPEGVRKDRLEYRKKVMHKEGIYCSEMEIGLMTAIAHLAHLKGYDVRIGGIMAVVNNPRSEKDQGHTAFFANERVIGEAVDKAINLGIETTVQVYKQQYLQQL